MITVLNRETGQPIDPQRPPVEGDWVTDGTATYEYHEPAAPLPDPLPITITSITGDVQHSSDFTRCTCFELTNLTVSGHVAAPDRTFALPLRRDDGRLFLFPVTTATDGTFNAVINLPTTGQFIYSDVEANVELPYQMFTVNTLKIDCLRNVP